MKSGLVSINTARQVNIAHSKTIVNAHRPMSYLSRTTHSTVKRPIHKFCEMKGILREFSVARTPQQNEVVERRNRILIEAARTMIADSKLPTTFWTEAVNTACYVQNRANLMEKADKGFFVKYSLNSKAFRVFNSRTRIVEESLHIRFSESTPKPDWLFDIDALTRIMNYEPIVAGTQSNGFAGTKASDNAGQARMETKPVKDYILLPFWTTDSPFSQDPKSFYHDTGFKPSSDDGKKVDEDLRKDSESYNQKKEDNINSTNNVNTVSSTVNVVGTNEVNVVARNRGISESNVNTCISRIPTLEDDSILNFSRDDEDDDVVADMRNLDTTIQVSPTPTTRIHKDHPLD
ncbi:ribonuclease H-like domain-containing protein [Tanacetum coccineum]